MCEVKVVDRRRSKPSGEGTLIIVFPMHSLALTPASIGTRMIHTTLSQGERLS